MRKTIVMPVILLSLMLLVSCKTTKTPTVGAVVTQPSGFGEGSNAPDIMFVDMKGELYHLASFYRDATIIAFVGGDCLKRVNSHLFTIASKLSGNVSLVEICSQGTTSENGGQCRILRGIRGKNLISICDGAGKARSSYNVTTPTAVFVIDRMGVIKGIGTIEELDELGEKADLIAIEEEQRREKLYDGL
jgi:hypothetical protein